MGEADLADVTYDAFLMNGKGNNDPWTCKANPGDRVRFRLIGAGIVEWVSAGGALGGAAE